MLVCAEQIKELFLSGRGSCRFWQQRMEVEEVLGVGGVWRAVQQRSVTGSRVNQGVCQMTRLK